MNQNKTIIEFPRGIQVDIDNIPKDFEDMIRASFAAYTEGTSKDYTYQDKLCYIDVCRAILHGARDAGQCVMNLMKDRFEFEVSQNGEFPGERDFLAMEFFEACFDAGRTNLQAHYTGNCHKDEKIMKLLVRAIKTVIDYE